VRLAAAGGVLPGVAAGQWRIVRRDLGVWVGLDGAVRNVDLIAGHVAADVLRRATNCRRRTRVRRHYQGDLLESFIRPYDLSDPFTPMGRRRAGEGRRSSLAGQERGAGTEFRQGGT
jgi:hypothetical protein